MEEMAPKGRLRRIATLVACVAGLSCGTGLRDGNDEESVTRTIGPEGGQIAFMEGTLDIPKDSVDPAVPIILRRYPSIKHAGAIGPVFEIQVPKPGTFNQDPTIGISTIASVAVDSNSAIGYLTPSFAEVQWVPDQKTPNTYKPSCQSSAVCDLVQSQAFTNPGNLGDAGITTTVLQFAIVQRCIHTTECLKGLACNSGACQECPEDSPCSLGVP
jgi:hypothetical protein